MPLIKTTLTTLQQRKQAGLRFSCLTAYDASFARILDHAGIELILVGDSLGMVVQGHESTVAVDLDQMVYHSRCVSRVTQHAMVMADMPFMSYATPVMALESAARLMREGGAHIVKLEGGGFLRETISTLSDYGIPVCAHMGLLPQSVHKLGGYRVQGRDQGHAEQMVTDAQTLVAAGADLLLLECVPTALATQISQEISVPVIGIGAGSGCDAQVLVLHDMLGVTSGKRPRFTRDFLMGSGSVAAAVTAFKRAVEDGSFPSVDESFS